MTPRCDPEPTSPMTRDEAERRAAQLNAATTDPSGTWTAQRIGSEWHVVKIAGAAVHTNAPLKATTEQRPKPDYAPDPRPLNEQNAPPYGAGG